jgi:hypothetical protein
MNKKVYILLVLLFCAGTLVAQNLSFKVSISSQQVAVGEQIQIDFTLNGNGDRFAPPSFAGFQVLSGPNVSTSMTSINGNTTTSTGYSYILAAEKEGDFIIGPATIYVNGRLLATAIVRMHVTKGQPQQRRQQQQKQQQAQQQQQQQGGGQVEKVSAADISKSLFIRAVVDKSRVYQGEQINVSYRVYFRTDILQNQVDKIPELNGFWSQDNNAPGQAVAPRTEVFNGVPYNVADVKNIVPPTLGRADYRPIANDLYCARAKAGT